MLPGAGVWILAGQPVLKWGKVEAHDNLLLVGLQEIIIAFRKAKCAHLIHYLVYRAKVITEVVDNFILQIEDCVMRPLPYG